MRRLLLRRRRSRFLVSSFFFFLFCRVFLPGGFFGGGFLVVRVACSIIDIVLAAVLKAGILLMRLSSSWISGAACSYGS